MRVKVPGRLVTAATVAAALVCAVPSMALAQGPSNPLAPGLPAPTGPTPTTSTPPIVAPTTTSATSSGSGLSGSAAIIIALGAIALLAGIAYFIWRDARRRAPVRGAHATAGVGARGGSKRAIKPRKLSPAERRRRKRGRAR
jgi:hypothetical protein